MNFKRRLSLAIMTMCLGVCLTYAQSISPQKDDRKGMWGYVNPTTGKWVVKPKYESAGQLTTQPDGKMKGVVVKNGLTGFVDENGKELGAGIVFEDMTPLQGDAMFVTVKGKKGVANYDGVYLIKPEITEIQPVGDEGYIVTIKDKKGFLAPDGHMTIDPVYTYIDPKTEGYFIVMKKDKMGILKRDGSMILEPKQFTDVEKYGDYWKVSKEDKTGLFKEGQSKLLVECYFEDILSPSLLNNLPMFPVKKNGLWGLVDSNGYKVISCNNDAIPVCINQENLVICHTEDSGYRLWSPKDDAYLELSSVENGYVGPYVYYWIKRPDKDVISEFAMSNGASIPEDIKEINWILESQKSKSQYIYVEKTDGTYSIYRETEQQPLITGLKEKPEYINDWLLTSDRAISKQGELRECSRDSKTIFIKDKDDRWYLLTPTGLDTSSPFDEITKYDSYFNVKANGKWGRVSDGNIAIRCKYPAPLLSPIFKNEAIYKMSDGNSFGIVNTITDNTIIPLSAGYTDIDILDIYKSHLVKVKKGDVWGVVNCDNGDECIPISAGYSEIETIYLAFGNVCKVKKGNVWGVVNCHNGDEIIPISAGYSEIECPTFSDRELKVKKGNKYGVVNYENGDKILPPIYDDINIICMMCRDNIIKAYKGDHFTSFELDGKEVTLDPHFELKSFDGLSFGVRFHDLEYGTYEIVGEIYTSDGRYLGSVSKTYDPHTARPITYLNNLYEDKFPIDKLKGGYPKSGIYVLKITAYDSEGNSVPIKGELKTQREFYR